MTEVFPYITRKKAQDFAILIINTQELWHTFKNPAFKVEKQIVNV